MTCLERLTHSDRVTFKNCGHRWKEAVTDTNEEVEEKETNKVNKLFSTFPADCGAKGHLRCNAEQRRRMRLKANCAAHKEELYRSLLPFPFSY